MPPPSSSGFTKWLYGAWISNFTCSSKRFDKPCLCRFSYKTFGTIQHSLGSEYPKRNVFIYPKPPPNQPLLNEHFELGHVIHVGLSAFEKNRFDQTQLFIFAISSTRWWMCQHWLSNLHVLSCWVQDMETGPAHNFWSQCPDKILSEHALSENLQEIKIISATHNLAQTSCIFQNLIHWEAGGWTSSRQYLSAALLSTIVIHIL